MSISCLSSKVPMRVRRPLAMPVQSRFKASHMAGTTSLPSSTGATKSAGWATLSARSSASMTSLEVEDITVPIMNTDIALITNALLCFLVATLPRGSDRVCRLASSALPCTAGTARNDRSGDRELFHVVRVTCHNLSLVEVRSVRSV